MGKMAEGADDSGFGGIGAGRETTDQQEWARRALVRWSTTDAAVDFVMERPPVTFLIKLMKMGCSFGGKVNVVLTKPVSSKVEGQMRMMAMKLGISWQWVRNLEQSWWEAGKVKWVRDMQDWLSVCVDWLGLERDRNEWICSKRYDVIWRCTVIATLLSMACWH